MVNSVDFTKRIQKIMDKNDLNASSFAEAINVGRSSISHILSGRNKPSLDLVMSIVAKFPDVDLYWLLNGKGTYPKSEPTTTSPTPNKNLKVSPDPSISNNSKKETKTETSSVPVDLFSVTETAVTEKNENSNKGKNISKVIILYTDGTFKDYHPE